MRNTARRDYLSGADAHETVLRRAHIESVPLSSAGMFDPTTRKLHTLDEQRFGEVVSRTHCPYRRVKKTDKLDAFTQGPFCALEYGTEEHRTLFFAWDWIVANGIDWPW